MDQAPAENNNNAFAAAAAVAERAKQAALAILQPGHQHGNPEERPAEFLNLLVNFRRPGECLAGVGMIHNTTL